MLERLAACLSLCLAVTAATPAGAQNCAFSCARRETLAYLPDLQTSSGYRWIECVVLGPATADVESVAVNNGKCKSFDYWYAGRSFAPGQSIVIPYACMSPVNVTISANGFWWPVTLR